MTQSIEAVVKRCKVCVEFAPRRQKEPLYCPNELVSRPMECLHVDIFTVKNAKYLFVIDEFSLYPWYCKYTKDPSVKQFIDGLQEIFFGHGFPERIRTDWCPDDIC